LGEGCAFARERAKSIQLAVDDKATAWTLRRRRPTQEKDLDDAPNCTSQHRISAGIGKVDVLLGLNRDLMAGGMFRDREQLGDFTTTSIASYWVSFGLTYHYGSGS